MITEYDVQRSLDLYYEYTYTHGKKIKENTKKILEPIRLASKVKDLDLNCVSFLKDMGVSEAFLDLDGDVQKLIEYIQRKPGLKKSIENVFCGAIRVESSRDGSSLYNIDAVILKFAASVSKILGFDTWKYAAKWHGGGAIVFDSRLKKKDQKR